MAKNEKMNRMTEILRFVITGGVCFVIEFVALVLLRDGLLVGAMGTAPKTATLIATPIAFLISVIVNYLLCMVWVFEGTKDAGNAAKAGFVVTSLIGLVLNELLMLALGLMLGEDAILLTIMGKNVTMYMINKMAATLIVMVWNYFTKRAVLQSGFVVAMMKKLMK